MERVDSKTPRYLRSCRLCGIHGSHQTMDGELANKIRACFGLAISLKDSTLPKTVCTRCTAKVNEMEKYRKFFMYVQLEHFLKRSQYFAKTEQNSIKVLRESVTQVELSSTGDPNGIPPAERINHDRIKQTPPRIGLIITQNTIPRPVASRRSRVSSRHPSASAYAAHSRNRRSHHSPASSSSSRSSSPSPFSSSCSSSSDRSTSSSFVRSYRRSCRSVPSTSLRPASPTSGTSGPPPETYASHPLPTCSARPTSLSSNSSGLFPRPISSRPAPSNTSSELPPHNTSSHLPTSRPPPANTSVRTIPPLPAACSVKPATTLRPAIRSAVPRVQVSSTTLHPPIDSKPLRPVRPPAPSQGSYTPVPSSILPDLSKTKLPPTTSVELISPTPTTASCPAILTTASSSTVPSIGLRPPAPSTTSRLLISPTVVDHTIPSTPSRPLPLGLCPEAFSIPEHPKDPSTSSLIPIPSTGLQLPNPRSPAHTPVPSAIESPQISVVPSSIISPSVSPSPSSSPSTSIPPSPVSSCTSPPFVYSRSLPCSPTPSIIVPAVDIEEEARKDDKSIETEKISSVEVVQIAVPVDPVPGESGESIEHKVMVREKTIIKEKIETVEEAHEPIVTNLAGPVNTDSLKLEALKPDLSMEDVMEDMIEVLEPEHLEQLAIDSIGDDIEGEFLNDSISKVDTDAHEQETEADDDSTMVFGEEHLEVQLEENEKYETVSIVDATEMVEILEAEFDTEDTTQGECDENVAEVTRRPVQETRRAAQQTRRRRRSKISGKELYKSLLTECTICHKNIERNRLEGHLNRHAGRRPYSCPTEGCTARFHCKHACRLHVRCRHGTESFPCQKCDKVYKAKRDLLGHMRETHSEPRFVCDICLKKFTTKSRLKQHRNYHMNERNHPCHICKTSFFNNFQLKVHMRSHTKIRPYRCTICTKEFRYRHMAKEHLTKDHGIENSAQKDWVIQFPEPDPEEVDIVEGVTNMVRYNVQRLIEPNDEDAVNVGTIN